MFQRKPLRCLKNCGPMEPETLTDIPLLERSPEEQERQPDLGAEGNEQTYLRPAAAAAFQTTIDETNRLCRDILDNESAWLANPLSTTQQSVLYAVGSNKYILRGHTTSSTERLLTLLSKMPFANDPLVEPLKELETFPEKNLRVIQWQTKSNANGFLSRLWQSTVVTSVIAVSCAGRQWVTHRFIPLHRHQVKPATLRDGYIHVRLSGTRTITILFCIPGVTADDARHVHDYLPYLDRLAENWTHYQ